MKPCGEGKLHIMRYMRGVCVVCVSRVYVWCECVNVCTHVCMCVCVVYV